MFRRGALGAGRNSREHVFPDWILRHFNIGDHVISPKAWDGDTDLIGERCHPLSSFRLGGVCSGCNGGWMSRLEQRTKPNLIALSSGARRLEGLSHPEQAILSRWAVKTAFVLHAASYPLAKIPRSVHPELQQRGDLPKGISVVAMQTPDLADDILAVTAIQSDRHVCLDAGRVSKPLGCWKISLRVGMLQLLISYCPDDRWAPLAWRGVHQPVWPTRGSPLV